MRRGVSLPWPRHAVCRPRRMRELENSRGVEMTSGKPEWHEAASGGMVLSNIANRAISHHLVDVTMFWSAASGGVRRYLMRKRDWLAAQPGWRHTIVAPGANGPGMIDCGGLPLPFSGGYCLPFLREQAAAQLTNQQPDLIEAGDPYRLAWSALDAAQRLGVPSVAFAHSHIAAMAECLAGAASGRRRGGPLSGLARRAAEAYLKRVYARFDLVLAPSDWMTGELKALGIEHVERQNLGVDSRVFHPCRRDPAWREALHLPRNARVLLYAGRFAAEKNLPLLVAAIERLGPPYVLLAIGGGPRPPAGSRVRILSYEAHASELARAYASVDGFVHAGDQETFGLSALEAMASGTPVAVCGRAGLGELVGSEAGIAVSSGKPEAWAEAIASLFDGEREKRVRAGRRRAEALDWRRVLPELSTRYARLIENAGRATGRGSVPMAHPATKSRAAA